MPLKPPTQNQVTPGAKIVRCRNGTSLPIAWLRVKNLEAAWRKHIPEAAPHQRATGRRRLAITRVMGPRERPYDLFNLCGGLKVVVDLLIGKGWLVDDDEKHCDEQMPVQRYAGPGEPCPMTVFEVEDLDGRPGSTLRTAVISPSVSSAKRINNQKIRCARMAVVYRPVSSLKPAPYNPRRMDDEERAQLTRSVQRWGVVDPLVVNRRASGWMAPKRGEYVVGGHQRLEVVKALGMPTVPVVYVALPPAEEKLLNLALNKIAGSFDATLLAPLLKELRAVEGGLDAAGFDGDELDELIASAERDLDAAEVDEDEIPPLPLKARTKPGELVQLGEHRLLCGDARNSADLRALMDGQSADMVWTDPPYGVSYAGKSARALRIQGDDRGTLVALLESSFVAIDAVAKRGAAIYVARPSGACASTFIAAFERHWRLRQELVWVKDSLVLGHSDYHYRHEGILYGNKDARGRFGRGWSGWHGGQDQDTVFEVPRSKSSSLHPTVKPVAVIVAHLRNSSARGAAVLDPFAGSGSTLIACQRMGRRAFLMEIDPAYCDVIRERYRRCAGREAA